MGLLKDWYDSHNSYDSDDWEELDCDDLVFDDSDDDAGLLASDNDDFLNTPVTWSESLFADIGNLSREIQERWEERDSLSRKSSRKYKPDMGRTNDRDYSASRQSSREYVPDTGWTRYGFIEWVGGPIRIARDRDGDVVEVFRHGVPVYAGTGHPVRVPKNRRATSAQWCDGVLYIQLSNGHVYECWGPYDGFEK